MTKLFSGVLLTSSTFPLLYNLRKREKIGRGLVGVNFRATIGVSSEAAAGMAERSQQSGKLHRTVI